MTLSRRRGDVALVADVVPNEMMDVTEPRHIEGALIAFMVSFKSRTGTTVAARFFAEPAVPDHQRDDEPRIGVFSRLRVTALAALVVSGPCPAFRGLFWRFVSRTHEHLLAVSLSPRRITRFPGVHGLSPYSHFLRMRLVPAPLTFVPGVARFPWRVETSVAFPQVRAVGLAEALATAFLVLKISGAVRPSADGFFAFHRPLPSASRSMTGFALVVTAEAVLAVVRQAIRAAAVLAECLGRFFRSTPGAPFHVSMMAQTNALCA